MCEWTLVLHSPCYRLQLSRAPPDPHPLLMLRSYQPIGRVNNPCTEARHAVLCTPAAAGIQDGTNAWHRRQRMFAASVKKLSGGSGC